MRTMGRLRAFAPRIVVVATVFLFATATLTFAAAQRITGLSQPTVAADAKQQVLSVPDVTGQAYVFAKGMLEDAGFAWHLRHGSLGFAGYRVAAQSPAAGTRLIDTGAPTIVLRLVPGGSYSRQDHTPDQGSPYKGTAVRLANAVSVEVAPSVRKQAKPTAAAKSAPRARPKRVAKHAAAKPAARTRAFVVAGAPREPLDEIPLTNRARLLGKWVAVAKQPSAPNVRHWLYQHAWIVAGARYGWSNGAEALRLLIVVDQAVEREWGMGSRSEGEARQALSFVQSHSS
jgi:hypothetical protein